MNPPDLFPEADARRTTGRVRRTAAALFILVAGCASPPEQSPWREREKVLQPAGSPRSASGHLVVETVFLGTDNGDELRQPFFLYDDQGKYRDRFPNHSMSPVALPPGRYVVVTRILLTHKRVQVVVKEGLTTRVSLQDFKSAPETSGEREGIVHEQ